MVRPGPRKPLRSKALLKNVFPPSPEPFTVPTYASPSITQYTTPNFSTKTRPPLTAPNHSSSSIQLLPSSASAQPTNSLISAITNRKTIEKKHQEALAKKRKRDMEAQEGYRSLKDDIQKYKYTGGDPRIDWDAVRGDVDKEEAEPGKSGGEASGMADEANTRKERSSGGTVAQEDGRDGQGRRRYGETDAVGYRGRSSRAELNFEPEMSGRRQALEPLAQQSLEVDVGSEEENDDQFDKILASKKRNGERTHRLLSPTIKPFRSITKPNELTAQTSHKAQQPTKTAYNAQTRLTTSKIALTLHHTKMTPQGNSRQPGKEEAARRRRAAVEKEEAAKRRRAAMARGAATSQSKDEYGDDAFDNSLGSAMVFDDGTDIYADEGFDNMLAQALASGQGFD